MLDRGKTLLQACVMEAGREEALRQVLDATGARMVLSFLGGCALATFTAVSRWCASLQDECAVIASSRVPRCSAWPGRSVLFSAWALEAPRAAVRACWCALLELLQADFDAASAALQGRFCVGFLYNANYVPACVEGSGNRVMRMVEEVATVELEGPPQLLPEGRGAWLPCTYLYDRYRLRCGDAGGLKWERNRSQGKRNTCEVVRIALYCSEPDPD